MALTAATGCTGAEIGAVAVLGGLGVVAATPVVFAISLLFFAIVLKAKDCIEGARNAKLPAKQKTEEVQQQESLVEKTPQQIQDDSLNASALLLMSYGVITSPLGEEVAN